ncbi:MAG TPA: DNA polymerase I [Firmicutes bacterium]|nr:DNA polymerase I [Bacillota bacterium]
MSESAEKLVLIDGNSLANRAFYALPRLTTSAGVPTNAVYGFITMLLRLIEEEKPEYMGVAFDRSAPTFRHLASVTYKAQRSGSPEDFKAQIPLIKKVLNAAGIRALELEGYEADDIIGTIASKAQTAGLRVVVVSGDRDMLQLVGKNVSAVITKRGITQVERYDREAVKRETGIYPEQIPDYKGLAGDQSDNIKGVTGIGPKTAVKLLDEFGSLENLLEQLDKIPSSHVREAMQKGRDQAILSKTLATIKRDVPVPCEVADLRVASPDIEALVSLFEELEFRSQIERAKTALAPYCPTRRTYSGSSEAKHVTAEVEVEFETVDSESSMERLRSEVGQAARAGNVIGLAISSVGNDPKSRKLYGTALHLNGKTWYLPDEEKTKAIGMALRGGRVAAFDAKGCMNALANSGVDGIAIDFDPWIAAYLLDPTRAAYYPEDLAREYVGSSYPRLGAGATAKHLDSLSPSECCALAWLAASLEQPMLAELQRQELAELFRKIEMPLVPVLSAMELEGIGVDMDIAREMSREFASKIKLCEQEIFHMAGTEFNVNSPRQLADVLFDKLGLPCSKKTKTGYSTSAEVLEELARHYEIAAKVLEYRQLAKLKGTYLDGLEALVNPVTGRIHTTFNQTVTATGRLSSTNPNMQNIPTKGELGRQLRRIFVPRENQLFLSADYSQIELRVLAHVSGDSTLIQSFLNGEDIHTRTAAEVFGVKPEEVTPSMRSKAKAINFGIIYGQTDYGLSRTIGESRAEAKAYIESYFRRYPGVREYIESAIALARETGYARTLMGRRRRLPDINSPNRNLRGFAERTAINTPIQGTAADIMKLAMIRCYEALKKFSPEVKILLQVHDELVLEVPRGLLHEAASVICREMENVIELRVPLKVSAESGPNWLDMTPID